MPKQESSPFKNYFTFILTLNFLGIVAIAASITSLITSDNISSAQAILPTAIALILMILLFTILLTCKNKISETIKREESLNQFLQKSHFSKTKFIKSASHDLKNYIFGISGMLKLILQNKTAAEIEENETLKMTEELYLQSQELTKFVEDLFDITHNEDEELGQNNKQICNIIELAKRMVILNKNFAMKNRINLEFDNKTKCQAVKIECHVKTLKKVLNSLIRNAIAHSKTASIVILQISFNHDEVQISVIDQGIGISVEEIKSALLEDNKIITADLDKIFDSHNLTILTMKKLIEFYNGRFEISSVKDYGSETKINFAAYKDQAKPNDDQHNNIDSKFENKAVLIAEDNVITSKIVTFLLRKMGFTVKHVENGAEILEQLDKQHFDLILLDINMPKLGGLETAKIIREGKIFKRFKNYDIPIIAISTEKQLLSDLKTSGINMMLGKPFSEKELIDFVMEYVK